MKELDINSFLQKAEELKALFVLGQRVIPFLEDIFIFFKEIQPLLEEINISIEDNLKRMPNASKQLSKVTEATELATTEIMDIIDGVFYKSDMIEKNLKQMSEIYDSKASSPLKCFDLLQQAMNSEKEVSDIMPQISETVNNMKTGNSEEFEELVNNSSNIINTLREDSNSIMMSLQVQDITSQQIAAVNHLLTTVQEKLGTILNKFNDKNFETISESGSNYNEGTDISSLHRDVAFDPDAIEAITNKESRQDDIDSFIEKAKNETENEPIESTSKDAIDALFSNQKEVTDDDVDDNPVSQDDIDALFGK